MANPQASTHLSSRPRNRQLSRPLPLPPPGPEHGELRELLETHLLAMQALLEEHERVLARTAHALEGTRAELRAQVLPELRALGDQRAPWVRALAETRALLFVALREVIVGDEDPSATMKIDVTPPPEAYRPS
jgi:hypothetical protein